MKRLHYLDYLRGLAACGIMIYHYISWTIRPFSAEDFLGKVGIYGVAVFYVLSGLTLFHVYYDKMIPGKASVLSFFKKRFLRIFPLLWVVMVVAILLSGQLPGLPKLLLNVTGLFAVYHWDDTFSRGVWSIGNELVFYLFFPVFVLLVKKAKPLMWILAVVLSTIFLYFTFTLLDSGAPLAHQWKMYPNPLNQVFLFMSGFMIGYLLQHKKIPTMLLLILPVAASVLFISYPVSGDLITLVTGSNRLVFSACCIVLCACLYKLTLTLPGFLHRPLSALGEASYSVYLLHPLVFIMVEMIINKWGAYLPQVSIPVKLAISVIATLVISRVVYRYFETYWMQKGRSVQEPIVVTNKPLVDEVASRITDH